MEAHLLAVLLSWTVKLSQYEHPGIPPDIDFKPHTFFVEEACNGMERCEVVAWYNDNGVIYIDERLNGHTDAYTRSVIVHELTHYLQDFDK
ncbi:MAG: hypothetical protein AAF410_02455 [Pseudomonadota bacterium]